MKPLLGITCLVLTLNSLSCSNSGSEKGFQASFAKGVKKDLSTGMKTSYNGLSLEEDYLVDENDEQLSSNEIKMGSKFSVVLTGVENFKLENDRAFPGLSIIVKDETGKEVMNTGDLFSDYANGFSKEESETLRASLTVGS